MIQDMTPRFLQLVANDLYRKFNGDLADIVVVFPNNRARLFFSEELFRAGSGSPVWSPSYMTISELIRSESPSTLADPLQLISMLYKVYCKETGMKESFDEFYFWGEILLNDFDDVDKNMTDAKQLFTNVEELNAYQNNLDYLTGEQKEELKRFFGHFDPEHRTELKNRFATVWNKLLSVYLSFRQTLYDEGIAYEGMVYREAVEKLLREGTEALTYHTYVFVGFNVLNVAETRFFKLMQDAGKGIFYWDYDLYFLNNPQHEAATFLRKNLELFPNQLGKEHFDIFQKQEKTITLIAASTENAQARYLPQWVEELSQKGSFVPSQSAVVLCNENLLLPVLHAIPQEISDINVTMGFPLAQTPLYDLIDSLVTMQTKGFDASSGKYRYSYLLPVLRHSYITKLTPRAMELEEHLTKNKSFFPKATELHKDEMLTLLFSPAENSVLLADYLLNILTQLTSCFKPSGTSDNEQLEEDDFLGKESLLKAYLLINRLRSLMQMEDIELRNTTFVRLLQQMLSVATIPFNGEPVRGLQIMGVLETRNLDFDNLLLLSVNEGMLPKAANENSFIPYLLRKTFGLTTIEHTNSLYAYYFFRVLQRAKQITLMYNTSCDGMNRGEMSRFLLQLLAESNFQVRQMEIHSVVSAPMEKTITIPKTEELMKSLHQRYNTACNPKATKLSPSALNKLIDCSLQFYFHYLAGLKQEDETTEEIDNAMFGIIFHKSAELLYHEIKTRTGGIVTKEYLEQCEKSPLLVENIVHQAFSDSFFKKDTPLEDYNGLQLINRKVVIDFMHTLIKLDKEYAPFTLVAMEYNQANELITVETPSGNVALRIGGIVDRIDLKEGTLRVVDYKTGGSPLKLSAIEALFEQKKNRPNYIFQAFLYSLILLHKGEYKQIAPILLYIHKASVDGYSPAIEMTGKGPVTDIKEIEEEYIQQLNKLLSDLFDPDIPFKQTTVEENCTYCDFKNMCRR
ncbi:MAG: PD-(D/E)XK nuclease family protein [Bacteroidales bacterium]|nr:PD-(D/E)XK nuclease family protein [Bacteroidales bacterium]